MQGGGLGPRPGLPAPHLSPEGCPRGGLCPPGLILAGRDAIWPPLSPPVFRGGEPRPRPPLSPSPPPPSATLRFRRRRPSPATTPPPGPSQLRWPGGRSRRLLFCPAGPPSPCSTRHTRKVCAVRSPPTLHSPRGSGGTAPSPLYLFDAGTLRSIHA